MVTNTFIELAIIQWNNDSQTLKGGGREHFSFVRGNKTLTWPNLTSPLFGLYSTWMLPTNSLLESDSHICLYRTKLEMQRMYSTTIFTAITLR